MDAAPMGPRQAIRTLVLTDIVDSTALVERLGDLRAAELFADVDATTRALLQTHGGQEIDRTDGFLMAFEEAVAAVRLALGLQAALRSEPSEGVAPIRVRAGLNRGEVVLRDNRAEDVARGAKPVELDGLAKPVAARVMSVAGGGQTLVSPAVRQALGPDSGLRVESHGHWRLKGVAEPIELFGVAGSTRLDVLLADARVASAEGREAQVAERLDEARDLVETMGLEPPSKLARELAALHPSTTG